MSEIYKGAKDLAEKCPECKHPKTNHMHTPWGEGRMRGKPTFRSCTECFKLGKEPCNYYK